METGDPLSGRTVAPSAPPTPAPGTPPGTPPETSPETLPEVRGAAAPGGRAGLPAAVAALVAEAEAATAELARLRRAIEEGEARRRRLLAAIEAAHGLLPEAERAALAGRIRGLAEGAAARRGRRPDSRRAEVIRLLAELAAEGIETVRIAEVQARLERAGHHALPRGYASNTLASLARDGMVTRTTRGRVRINPVHPEILDLRFQMLDALKAKWEAR